MAMYQSAVDAYRDTTKWLVAFTPLTALATSAVLLAPSISASVAASRSDFGIWLSDYWLLAVAGVLVIAGIGAVIMSGARVLSAREPANLLDLVTSNKTASVIDAGKGSLAPDFLTLADFEAEVTAIANGGGDEALRTRVRAALLTLQELALFRDIRARFRCFAIVFWSATAAIVIGVVLALTVESPGTVIDLPTPVTVSMSSSTAAQMLRTTGCTDVDSTSFTATGGTWRTPELAAAGPGCEPAGRWWPDTREVIVVPE